MSTDQKPTPKAVREQLERILKSAVFKASEKQRRFLSFIVGETLEERTPQLKGYTIAVHVYGRSDNFDPQVDPIVRVEAGRLRRALEHYYLTAGKGDPVRIQIPKGGYVPTFHAVQISPHGNKTRSSKPEVRSVTAEPSIAIMPLINLTGDDEQDYFTDGLTEELTVELSRYQEFKVIASQSTMRFKYRKADPRKVGKQLGVRFLLTGSFRMEQKTIKVIIRLIDTSNAEQIWGESYKRDHTAADLISIQEEITSKVIGVIADQYGLITRRLSRESGKKAPDDLRVYDAVLRFYHYESKLTPDAFEKALVALEQAVEIDPNYGLAWAMLGHLHADNYALGFSQIETPLEKALTFAQKGVALAPEVQFTHDALTLVYFHQGDKEKFLEQVEKTIALNPNAPYITGVAGWHMMLYGEWERGLALLRKGMKLNPFYPSWFHLATYMDYYRRGDYKNAFAEAQKFNYPELYLDPLIRAAALGQMEKMQKARAAVDELLKLEPEFFARRQQLVSCYVKVDKLCDKVIEGLLKAGLNDPVN